MFQAIFPLSKYLKIKSVRIYDFAFALHSKVSVTILLACTLLLSARQFFGQPIECMSSEKQLDFINLFCWTMGTYILTYPDGRMKNRTDSIAVGVGGEYAGSERVYLRYYQWVVMILLMQALVFLFPAFLWKNWEGELMDKLCSGLERSPVFLEKEYKERRSRLLKFFTSDYSVVHRGYAKKYLVCEVMNFLICIFNLALMNIFFNGFWSNYSRAISRIPAYNWEEWNQMSSRVFPKLAKCEFFKFGVSGSSSRYDALCILPLNILNEKMFAFLYIWFLLLAVASAMHLTFRLILTCCSTIRVRFTQRRVGRSQKTQVRQLLETMSYSDWFLLMRINANIDPVIFADLIRDLSEILKYKNLESSA